MPIVGWGCLWWTLMVDAGDWVGVGHWVVVVGGVVQGRVRK